MWTASADAADRRDDVAALSVRNAGIDDRNSGAAYDEHGIALRDRLLAAVPRHGLDRVDALGDADRLVPRSIDDETRCAGQGDRDDGCSMHALRSV